MMMMTERCMRTLMNDGKRTFMLLITHFCDFAISLIPL